MGARRCHVPVDRQIALAGVLRLPIGGSGRERLTSINRRCREFKRREGSAV
jgi:hypothetical protein